MKIKINDKYEPLWTSDAYIHIVTGGRGSGKSFTVGDHIENLSFEAGHKILFTRFTLDSAGDSIIPEFQEKIGIEGHEANFSITKKDIINTYSGSEILFRGIKTSSGVQTAKLKSIEGLTDWVLDEAEELQDESTFDVIKQSIRKKGIKNKIILLLNPKSKDHWIYKRFFKDAGVEPGFNGQKDNVYYIHTTYLENLDNLSPEFIAEAEKCKKFTPELYAYQYMGDWVLSIEGAIFRIDKLNRYKQLNEEGTNLVYIDTADEGADHFAALFGRLIGNKFYAYDAIFNLHNLNINEPICKERFERHKTDRCYIESNSFGAYFIRNLRTQNEGLPIYGDVAKANKMGRILANSGWILENFYFPENPNEELSRFMNSMCSITTESKNNDDAADDASGLCARIRRDFHV